MSEFNYVLATSLCSGGEAYAIALQGAYDIIHGSPYLQNGSACQKGTHLPLFCIFKCACGRLGGGVRSEVAGSLSLKWHNYQKVTVSAFCVL